MKRGLRFCLESGDFLRHLSACLFEFIKSYIISLTPMGLRDTCSSTGGGAWWDTGKFHLSLRKCGNCWLAFHGGGYHHNPKTEVCPVTKLDLK